MQLFPHQERLRDGIYAGWRDGKRNMAYVLATGGGKTPIAASIFEAFDRPSCAIAHRQELVGQLALTFAKFGVPHGIEAPKAVLRWINNEQVARYGRSYCKPRAACRIAGVDTLNARKRHYAAWGKTVGLWMIDECHHLLRGNKWGKAVQLFPNAYGLGATATLVRSDGKGLGRDADGCFDDFVQGLCGRELIDTGFLTDYRVFAPRSDFHRAGVEVSETTGDFKSYSAARAVKQSRVIGDVVAEYLKHAAGKRGITFAPDIEAADMIVKRFNQSGVPAALVTADSTDAERNKATAALARGELLQLVNVDLFGEGFDLPVVEVVSMARPTKSFGLYSQQFGRVLRPLLDETVARYWGELTTEQRLAYIAASVKPHAIVIDHVGNVAEHKLPDPRREWTLERTKESRLTTSANPVRECPNPICNAVYERVYKHCPYCGHKPTIDARSGINFVDGDLEELDAATLAAMRAEIEKIDMPAEAYQSELARKGCPQAGMLANINRHVANQEAQRELRDAIALWGGHQRYLGRPDSESYRRFYFRFGVDVLSAQALKKKEAEKLTDKIRRDL